MQIVEHTLRQLNELLGRAVAWLSVPMVLGTFVVVVLRYVFGLGWIWMQEAVMWMHAALFMLASAYTLNRDAHVRVDVFYARMTPRGKALVNACGTVLFLLPMAAFLAVESFEYVQVSWAIREGSREAGGLPYPFVPLLKTLIPLTAVTLMLQGVAQLLASLLELAGRTAPER